MPEVPKLNLNFSSESQSGPDFKISQSSRSTHSSSTVSWGTESSDRLWTPKVSERQETKYSTNPPWATHLPLNRRKEADNFTGKQIPSFVHEENGSRIISDHNNTESDRICSALESDFRRRGTTENLTDKIQLDPTPRELSAMSLRQRPGLVR
ncbi:hypothetical protein D915_010413 [Fasciola hepatica]|uniref:Uncharacterized protein n=1 Tax=Fasciola hepatica TaxID=6192 RepID=A0A4E0QUL3_FASHE|nr:hypothetical protein D915_010413 [Fasciola hepatica]